MKRFAKPFSFVICALSLAAVASTADARPRKRHHHRHQASDVIVVHPRAFTDSGVVVPVGSQAGYVMQMTYFNKQPYEAYSPGILWKPFPTQR